MLYYLIIDINKYPDKYSMFEINFIKDICNKYDKGLRLSNKQLFKIYQIYQQKY